jgi:germination protein M
MSGARSPRWARTLLCIASALSLLLAACDDGDDPGAAPSDAPVTASPAASASPDAPPSASPTTMPVRLWLTLEDSISLTTRQALVMPPRFGTAAVTELVKGPTETEASNGFGTAVPGGSQLLDLAIADGIATVDLSSEFESGGGSLSVRLRLAQLVYTLTEFPTVQGVLVEIEGRPATTFSSEGFAIHSPLTREDFEDLVSPIVVEAPAPGDTVTSPVTVSGTANVFEANVSLRILGPDGEVIAETFTTATCGTGCRGTYSKNVPFQVVEETEGVIEVYESSAEDGSAIHVVRVPVVLAP